MSTASHNIDFDRLLRLRLVVARYGETVTIQYRQREAGAIVIDFTVVAGGNED